MVTAIESRPGTDPDRAGFTTALETAKDLLITAINIAGDTTDLSAHRPRRPRRAAPAPAITHQRPQGQIPLSRYNKKDPHRPERSTPITSLTATINDAETKHATRKEC